MSGAGMSRRCGRAVMAVLASVLVMANSNSPAAAGGEPASATRGPIAAATFARVAGGQWITGSGATARWSGGLATGAVRSYASAPSGADLKTAKAQAMLCAVVYPSFTGAAKIGTTVLLSGDLSAENASPWSYASADVQVIVQVDRKTASGQRVGFVGTQVWDQKRQVFDNVRRSHAVNQQVTKGVPIEICGGLMTNAGALFPGASAVADFFSSRFRVSTVTALSLTRN